MITAYSFPTQNMLMCTKKEKNLRGGETIYFRKAKKVKDMNYLKGEAYSTHILSHTRHTREKKKEKEEKKKKLKERDPLKIQDPLDNLFLLLSLFLVSCV